MGCGCKGKKTTASKASNNPLSRRERMEQVQQEKAKRLQLIRERLRKIANPT